jgi:hypothetical protein
VRDYSKVGPKFWIGDTGKKLKKAGAEAVVVGLYLMTSPHSNMLGLYYQPELLIAHETGLGFEGALKGLRSCIECGFCQYDAESEMVWVFEMATYQIAESLSASDKRSIGVQNDYNALPENPFLPAFFDKYQKAFNLTRRREMKGGSEAPSKPHRSQEQEQEQEQEHEQAQEQSAAPRKNPPAEIAKLDLPDWLPVDAWDAFVAMRKKIKAPMTDEAKRLAVIELEKLMQKGHRPRAVLEQSTLNSWRGLFEIKANRSGGDADSRQAFNERENAKAKQLLFGPEVDHAA